MSLWEDEHGCQFFLFHDTYVKQNHYLCPANCNHDDYERIARKSVENSC